MKRNKLKNFGKFLVGYLTAILTVVLLSMASCKKWPTTGPKDYSVDSIFVAEQVEEIVNPTFLTVQEVIQYRIDMNEGLSIDSTFLAMPESVLANVAGVLLNKSVMVNKRSIVEEYRANKGVYNNLPVETSSLPDNAPLQKVDQQSTDLGTRPSGVISTSYNYRTDTVNGKPIKIQIKTEESYAE